MAAVAVCVVAVAQHWLRIMWARNVNVNNIANSASAVCFQFSALSPHTHTTHTNLQAQPSQANGMSEANVRCAGIAVATAVATCSPAIRWSAELAMLRFADCAALAVSDFCVCVCECFSS